MIHRETFGASVLNHSDSNAVLHSVAKKKCLLTTPSLLSRGALRSKKYDTVIWFLRDSRSKGIQIHVQPGQSSFTDRHHTVSLAFPFSNSHEAMFLIHFFEFLI